MTTEGKYIIINSWLPLKKYIIVSSIFFFKLFELTNVFIVSIKNKIYKIK